MEVPWLDPLTHCTWLGIEPALLQPNSEPTVLQWKLPGLYLFIYFFLKTGLRSIDLSLGEATREKKNSHK